MAQWIAHWTSNPEVAGSNPVKSAAHNNHIYFCNTRNITFRDGVVGNISACHADARGSIPRRGVSLTITIDTLAEWLRRRPAKPLGSARTGSNPVGVESSFAWRIASKIIGYYFVTL